MSSKPFLKVLSGQRVDPPPVWLMRQAGRYLPEYRAVRAKAGTFLDLCLTPEHAVEVTLQPIRRYGFDAAILFSDILVVPYALGQPLTFVEGEGPRLGELPPIDSLRDRIESGVRDRLKPVLETVGRLSVDLPKETALIGFAGAPWTVACYMLTGGGDRDWNNARVAAYTRPEAVEGLLDVLVDATEVYLAAQVEAGAEAIQLFESWGGILPESAFRKFVIDPTRRLVGRLKVRCPGIPIIGFPRGSGVMAENYAVETGVDAVGIDWTVPAGWGAAHLQKRIPVQGNLDPVLLVAGGSAMAEETKSILKTFGHGPHIFNLGHGILPTTPPENVALLMEVIRNGG